jgi:DNA-binding NarL/FixJ family response regulator
LQNANITAANVRAPETSRLRILLVEDHALVREALKALLETDPGLEIVGEAATFAEALEAVDRLKPTVAVIDVGLPDRSGIELATELKARRSSTHVLVLTAHATREHVQAALNAGVLGYVLKDASYADLLKGLRAVSIGQMFLCVCESVKAQVLLPAPAGDATGSSWRSDVTCRECEVLTRVALGLGNKDIARSLHISVKTVEKHRGNLMRKLDLHGAAALTRFAIYEGLAGELGKFGSNTQREHPQTVLTFPGDGALPGRAGPDESQTDHALVVKPPRFAADAVTRMLVFGPRARPRR